MIHKLVSLAASVAVLPVVLVALPFVSPGSAAPAGAVAQPAADALPPLRVVSAASLAGFRGHALVTAVAIAGAESRWAATAEGDTHPINGCECHSHGVWQIRSCPKRDPQVTYDTSGCGKAPLDRGDRATLVDPDANASVAWALASSSGWDDWSTYVHGDYLAWLPLAEQAAAAFVTAHTQTSTTGGTP